MTERHCAYWDCSNTIHVEHFLCPYHYEEFQAGRINVCPGCDRYKATKYDLCMKCHQGTAPPKPGDDNPKRVISWVVDGDDETGFFVYILKLDDGAFYVGRTKDLRVRLSEHKDGAVKSTAGRHPMLKWFGTVPTLETAKSLEAELKRLASKNDRRIRKMIIDLEDLVKDLDLD